MHLTQSCPYCGEQICTIIGPHSGLGPSTLKCDVTGQPIQIDRREWSEMGHFRKTWYCLLSAIYAGLIGAWGLLMVFGVRSEMRMGMEAPATRTWIFLVFVGFVSAGLAMQIVRVRRSLHRTATGATLTHRTARRGLSMQITALFLMIILGVVIVQGAKWIQSLLI